MRTRTALLGLAILAAGCGGGSKSATPPPPPPPPTAPPPAAGVKVSITAATHRPKVNARLPYQVKASRGGKLTVQILDPFGGVHPVAYDNTKKNVTDFPFKGVFKDYLEFPAESRGFKLVVKATVKTSSGHGAATFWIKAR